MKQLSEKKKFEYETLYVSLIGKEVEILDSNNKNDVNSKGLIVFESSNMLYIQIKDKIKKFIKANLIIKVEILDSFVKLNCGLLQGNIDNRIKKLK